MKVNIVKIGNSQGIRIPKALLQQTNLHGKVNLEVRKNKLIISPAAEISWDELTGNDLAIMSEPALSDWNTPEEDKAWAYLQ